MPRSTVSEDGELRGERVLFPWSRCGSGEQEGNGSGSKYESKLDERKHCGDE